MSGGPSARVARECACARTETSRCLWHVDQRQPLRRRHDGRRRQSEALASELDVAGAGRQVHQQVVGSRAVESICCAARASGGRQAARVVVQDATCDATRPTIGPRITAAGAAPAAAPLAMWPYDMRRTPPTCARAQARDAGVRSGRQATAAAARTCAGLISLDAPSCTKGSVPSGSATSDGSTGRGCRRREADAAAPRRERTPG